MTATRFYFVVGSFRVVVAEKSIIIIINIFLLKIQFQLLEAPLEWEYSK